MTNYPFFSGDDYTNVTSFYICVDKVVLMEVDSPADALLSLIQLSFVFDLDYPSMPKTMEYLER